jgi:PAS domain S-box-containing protein
MAAIKIITKEKVIKYEQEIEKLNKSIKTAAEFINEIEKGNLEVDYKEGDENDLLRHSLISMKDKLKSISEQEKNQQWTNEGLAKFAEILRTRYDSINDFSYALVSNITKYLKANQAGIFILNEDDIDNKVLELSACYAYDRKKYIERSIKPGEGLLGECFLEKESIYITDIPNQYTTITSGLGQATPGCILIVPLKYNDVVVGVLEIASFKKMEKYEITFAEKVAESIASVISSVKINEKTERLLYETRAQTESLQAQEEEMRQNIEELQATQDKTESMNKELRKNQEMVDKLLLNNGENIKMLEYIENFKKILVAILDELPQKVFLKDSEGKFILINTAVANAHDMSIDQLLNTSDFDHFDFNDATEWREQELEIINGGKPVEYVHEESINGKNRVLKTMKKPLFLTHLNQDGGLLGIQTDITESVKLREELEATKAELLKYKRILNKNTSAYEV